MSQPFLKPRSAYETALTERASIASREAAALMRELAQHKSDLEDHGYQVERSGDMVAITRGPLDVVRVVFNYSDSGRHRVTNGIAEALRRGLDVDFDDPTVAKYEFKNQLRAATDLFYANKAQFQALGLA